jgi:hypothetical protein
MKKTRSKKSRDAVPLASYGIITSKKIYFYQLRASPSTKPYLMQAQIAKFIPVSMRISNVTMYTNYAV